MQRLYKFDWKKKQWLFESDGQTLVVKRSFIFLNLDLQHMKFLNILIASESSFFMVTSEKQLPKSQCFDEKLLVSIIIPAYNAERYIVSTLESVLAQTHCNIEVIVVDDGSQDNTTKIVRQYEQRDIRMRVLQQSNAGVAEARNLGIKAAKGEFIAPIDADDIWSPHNIALQLEAMKRGGPNVGLVYSWSVDIDESGKPTGRFRASKVSGHVLATLIGHNFIGNASATMMRRSCLNQVGGYDPALLAQNAQGCEDWDIYLRIAEKYEFKVVPKFLVGYRKIANSMSNNYSSMAKSHGAVMDFVQQRTPQLPQFLFRLSESNFYLHLAHQNNLAQQHSNTRIWLKKSFNAEMITSLCKPAFYGLLLSNSFISLTQWVRPSTKPIASTKTNLVIDISENQTECITSFNPSKLSLGWMLFIENAFCRLTRLLAKFSEHFKTRLRK